MSQRLVDELTDWHNLLQGGIGNLLGVVAAVGIAVWTVNRQRRHERALAREMEGVEAASAVEKSLDKVRDPLRSISIAREFQVDGGMPFNRAEEVLEDPVEKFSNTVREAGPLLPTEWRFCCAGSM